MRDPRNRAPSNLIKEGYLILRVQKGEIVCISDNIEIKVHKCSESGVKLAIKASKDIPIKRGKS